MLCGVLLFCLLALWSQADAYKAAELTVLGGEDASANELNYVVSLFIRRRNTNSGASCTGSIIADRWVLTAGHCVQGATTLTHVVEVYVGTKTAYQGTNLRAENWFLHEQYRVYDSPTRVYNDIAIIKLSSSATQVPNTEIAQLPLANEAPPIERTSVTVAGFGIEGEGDLAQPRRGVLKKASMRVKGICGNTFPYCIRATNINGRACNGDSGGPMVFNDKVVGVSSTGTVCSSTNGDAQYLQVSKYIDWINNKMNQ